MYENRHARFTAVDPLLASGKSANPQTFNRYVYVTNSPLLFTDPTGLIGDYYDSNGNLLGHDKHRKDGKVYFARKSKDQSNAPEGKVTIDVDSVVPTTMEAIERAQAGAPFTSKSWYSKYQPKNDDRLQRLLNGFPTNPYEQAANGFVTGVGNFGIHTTNLVTNSIVHVGAVFPRDNPYAIQPYSCSGSINCNWQFGAEVATGFAPIVVTGPFTGSSTVVSFTAPSVQRSVIVTEKGLNRVTSHLAQFGDDVGNTGMIKRLETRIGGRVSGADRNFYMHELKESTLMRRGIPYESAHNKSILWDKVSPFELYHPKVIQQNPAFFNPNFMKYWKSKQK